MAVGLGLQYRLVTVAGQTLEDVADLPFAGRDPLPVRRPFHSSAGLAHRRLAQIVQMLIKDFLVHRDLRLQDQWTILPSVAKNDGGTRHRAGRGRND
jgi:hypothetical protein